MNRDPEGVEYEDLDQYKQRIRSASSQMLSSEQNDEECDATGDAMKNGSWVNKKST
jgi:hypothetical protein